MTPIVLLCPCGNQIVSGELCAECEAMSRDGEVTYGEVTR